MATTDKVQCAVIGAGVVGLAVARALSLHGIEVLLIERASGIGTGKHCDDGLRTNDLVCMYVRRRWWLTNLMHDNFHPRVVCPSSEPTKVLTNHGCHLSSLLLLYSSTATHYGLLLLLMAVMFMMIYHGQSIYSNIITKFRGHPCRPLLPARFVQGPVLCGRQKDDVRLSVISRDLTQEMWQADCGNTTTSNGRDSTQDAPKSVGLWRAGCAALIGSRRSVPRTGTGLCRCTLVDFDWRVGFSLLYAEPSW